ncbi:MAG TPA: glycosyltransferase family 39 protein [Patescibacteria group bacterium]|nr:glycosyltransferase family 39 protein [Patescibacteria group bacterium]
MWSNVRRIFAKWWVEKSKNQIVFASILVVAIFGRFFDLGLGNLNNDEAKTALGIAFPHSHLLPWLTVASQMVLGVNEWAVRLPYALAGVMFVVVMYFLGKNIADRRMGLWLAGLAAILPSNVLLSRLAFLDVPLVLSWSLIVLFWVKIEKQPTKLNLSLLFFFLALAPWFKIQAVFLFIALFIHLLWRQRGRFWKGHEFWLMLLAGLPFLFYFLSQPQQLADLGHYLGTQAGTSSSGLFLLTVVKHFSLLLPLSVMGLVFLIRRKTDWSGPAGLLGIFFFVIFAVLVGGGFSYYYLVMLDIPILFFAVYPLSVLSGKKQWTRVWTGSLAISGLIFLLFIWSSFSLARINCQQKDFCAWQTVRVDLEQIAIDLAGEPVFVSNDLGFEARWYLSIPVYKQDHLDRYRVIHPQDRVWWLATKKESALTDSNWQKVNDWGVAVLMVQQGKI